MTTTEQGSLARAAAYLGKLVGGIAHSHKREPTHEDIHFEDSDISGRNVFLAGLGVLLGMWLFGSMMYFYFHFLADYRARVSPAPLPVAGRSEALPPQPRLQQSPHQDLKAYVARQDWELNNYYWIDQSKGIAAIPIEQAIKIVAQRGIPAENLAPNPTLTPPQEGTRLTGFEGKVEPEPR